MPSRINTAGPTHALIEAFKLQGDYRPQMDETVSPVVVIGRLDGGASSLWPRNLSADWRGATRTIRPTTNPAVWFRFRAPTGSTKRARITRVGVAPGTAASPAWLVIRGDLQTVLGGTAGALLAGTWTDDLQANPNAFTPPANSSFGLTPMTLTGAPLNFTANPALVVQGPGANFPYHAECGVDCPAGGIISIVPTLQGFASIANDQFRFEAVVSVPTLQVDWLEEF
jgi:hypothetical protein